jgi:hypothetical protein
MYYVDKYTDDIGMTELYLSPEQLEIALQSAKEQLKKRPELFLELTEDLVEDLVDCTVYITNEELDMGSMVDKLIMGANLLPEQDRGVVVRDIYDLLGIPYPQELLYKKTQAFQPDLQQMQQQLQSNNPMV